MKIFIRRWKEILIYYITFKQYYLCDRCKHIHKRMINDISLNEKYGLFVSNQCMNDTMVKLNKLLRNAIFGE